MSIVYREYLFQPDFPYLCLKNTRTASQADFIHFHNCLEIALCDQGTMHWNVEGQDFLLHPNEFCLVPPFATHSSFHPEQNTAAACYYFYMDASVLLEPIYPNGLPDEFSWFQYHGFSGPLSVDDYPQIVNLLHDMIKEHTLKPDLYRYKIASDVDYLMILMYRQLYKKSARPEDSGRADRARIFPAIRLIDEQYVKPLSNSELASACHITQKQFLQSFQIAMRKTPAQYIREVKIHKACFALVRTEKPIVEIAYETGFLSLSSFNRNFLQVIGQTPTQYRSERREIRKNNTTYAPFQTT